MNALPLRAAVRTALAAGLALALAPAPAHAQGLVDAWRAAARVDADLAVARAARAVGAARGAQAGTLFAPQVGLSATAGIGRSETSVDGARFAAPAFGTVDDAAFRTSVDGGSGRIALQARQPLWSGELGAQARQLGHVAQAAEQQGRAAEQQAMLRTAERWLDLALAAEALRVAERQQGAVDRALAEATDRWKIGDAPVVGTHEARARAEAVRAQAIGARTELEVRTDLLADATGLARDALRPGVPAATPADDAPEPLGRWLDEAAAAQPAIRAQAAAVEAAREEAARSARGAATRVDLVAQAARERIGGSGDFGGSASAATQALVGVQLSLPLWTGGAREAQHEEALRRVDQAQAELERVRRQVARDVRAAWLALDAGRARVQALEQGLVASRARLASTRTGREVGDRTTLDVLNAEADLAQAELGLAQARVALLRDRLRLEALAGRIDEAALARADAALAAR
jgi:outer membrane protein